MLDNLRQWLYRKIVPDFKIVFDWGNFAPGDEKLPWLNDGTYIYDPEYPEDHIPHDG